MKKSLGLFLGILLFASPVFAQTAPTADTYKIQLIAVLVQLVQQLEAQLAQLIAAQGQIATQQQTFTNQPQVKAISSFTPMGTSNPSTESTTTTQETPDLGVVSDSFDSYSVGPIAGQAGWSNRANGSSWIVESTTTEEGMAALYSANTDGDSVITKTGPTASMDGIQSYWVYPQNPQGWRSYNLGENVQMGVYQGSWDGPTRTVMAFMQDGRVAYIDPRTNKFVEFDTYDANAWNLAQIQWRSSDNTARFSVNGDAWSSWIPLVGASSFTGFDTVGFVTFYLGTGGIYIDNIQ